MEIKPIEAFYSNGEIESRTYLNAAGELHRDPNEGPAIEAWYSNGQKRIQTYWVDGKVHRDPSQGPAAESWYLNGQKHSQKHYVGDKPHRDRLKGPAIEFWNENGTKHSENYYVGGKEVPKPKIAKVEINVEVEPIEIFYSNGKIRSREYKNAAGRRHRDPIEGPAYEYWYSDGDIRTQYCVDGREVARPENQGVQNDKISKPQARNDDLNITSSIVGSMLVASLVAILCRKNTPSPSLQQENKSNEVPAYSNFSL